ncbi:MAG: nucleotidyltransferase substrate binding protein [Gallionellaceae bacterium]|nr:nucleotidyltransferase substrate binding protein [Gallionellaceae bacterium]
MNDPDIRWQQRLSHYQQALAQLSSAVGLSQQRPLSRIEQQGLIKAFEFTHELAWNVMKDFFEFQGEHSIMGSRDATRLAFARGLIADGDGWMEMIKSRNQTTHTYNVSTADEIAGSIIAAYHALLLSFADKMEALQNAG